jgi:nucleotide-binding universal stress UspA family protein
VNVVVVAVNDSIGSRDALRWAGARAASTGAALHVVTAVTLPLPVGSPAVTAVCHVDQRQLVDAGLEMQRRVVAETLPDPSLRPTITETVRVGEPFHVLRAASDDADLVVLGAGRGSRFRSLPRRCLKHLRCPVVVIADDRPS